jgi:hypothetical protein
MGVLQVYGSLGESLAYDLSDIFESIDIDIHGYSSDLSPLLPDPRSLGQFADRRECLITNGGKI